MKNPYGVLNSDGSIVYVDDVPRGLACNCVCPLCHKPFRACQGRKNQHYFAHQDASECEFSYRASLLKMVVDYLQSGELEIPAVVARYMNEEDMLYAGETVVFDRVEQHGDIKAPELHCFLGSRRWVLKPLFDKKIDPRVADTHLVLDLTRFSNPYESRPHQNLVQILTSKNLLRWKNYPGVDEKKRDLRTRHQMTLSSERESTIHRFRITSPRRQPPVRSLSGERLTSKPACNFQESSLPCKFCQGTTPPKEIFMAMRSEGYCVCRACNRERGGDIYT